MKIVKNYFFFFNELWKSTNFIVTWRAFIQVSLSQNSSSVAPTFPANSLAADPEAILQLTTARNPEESQQARHTLEMELGERRGY